MPVQRNNQALRQQRLINPKSVNRNQYLSPTPSTGSSTVGAQLPLKKSARSSTGATNNQQKIWNKNIDGGHASKMVKTNSASPSDPNATGGRPKSGNWRTKKINSTKTDTSSTRFPTITKYLEMFF